jgi:hypothetical protein
MATPTAVKKVILNGGARAALTGASQLLVVGKQGFTSDGRDYIVLAVARPSTSRSGSGYCGAGTEDKLLLLEWARETRTLLLRDSLEIQSCLRSIELASDQGSELVKVLGGIDDPASFRLTWLDHPKYGHSSREVIAKRGRLLVQ